MDKLEERVSSLEAWRTEVLADRRVDDLRRQHMDERFDKVEKQLSDMRSVGNKVLLAMAMVIVTGFMNFILQGGLSFVP